MFQVNISQADMQAIGNTITMVTQDGTTITVPAHDAVISSAGTHSVAMVTAEGTEGQQVKNYPVYRGNVPSGMVQRRHKSHRGILHQAVSFPSEDYSVFYSISMQQQDILETIIGPQEKKNEVPI